MRQRVGKALMGVLCAAVLTSQVGAKPTSKSIVVESPAGLPELAQRSSEAMYLHQTEDGRTVLYLEQDQGQTLAILDVTNPAAIRALTQVSVGARSPYDFVQNMGDTAVLIHYRNHSGYALINFKKFKHPVLMEAPQLPHLADTEALGHNALLLTSQGPRNADPRSQEVVDISDPSKPVVLAAVESVQQRLDRSDTGTLFLLSNAGVTVIRRLDVEEDYKIALNQMNGN